MAQYHSEYLLHQQKSRMVLCCTSKSGRVPNLSEMRCILLFQLYEYMSILCMFCCQEIVQAPSQILPRIHLRSDWSQYSNHIDKILPCDMSYPRLFKQPLRYMRWASHEKPAIFYSFVIGSGGPLALLVAPPIRRYFNDGPREKIPMTYPSKLPMKSGQYAKAPSSAR